MYISKKLETNISKRNLHLMFIAAVFIIVKIQRQHASVDRLIDKENVVHICINNVIPLSHKKEKKILPFATTWINLESIMLSEISQMVKKLIPYSVTYMWNLRVKLIETEMVAKD